MEIFFERAASIRLAASVWWFFTLIMVASYTANLAAFLVKENKVSLINGIEDLANCTDDSDCVVSFGAKTTGSTLTFFEVSDKYVPWKILS